jgi:hypothetical protein
MAKSFEKSSGHVPVKGTKKLDELGMIMAYEDGQLSDLDTLKLNRKK